MRPSRDCISCSKSSETITRLYQLFQKQRDYHETTKVQTPESAVSDDQKNGAKTGNRHSNPPKYLGMAMRLDITGEVIKR